MQRANTDNENYDSVYMEDEQNTDHMLTQENMEQKNKEEQTVERIGAEYIPDMHDLGMEHQRLTKKVNSHGIPAQTTPYHLPKDSEFSEQGTEYDENGFAINKENTEHDLDNKKLWKWSRDGKLKLACAQPVVPVPIVQEILRRDKIILIPQVEVTDVIAPKVYNQNIKHEVPKLDMKVKDTYVEIPNVKYVEKEIIVPIITGYTHKFVPKWEIHEVPRPIMKYIGEQKIVEVEVPEIKYVDKIVEREVVVDTVEKRVPKIIEVPKYIDEVQYVWKPIEKIVYVQKLVPKFDVNLECPPPLIVPYPVQTIKHIPPVMVKRDTNIPLQDYDDYHVPSGSVKVPEEYIHQFSKHNKNQRNNKGCILTCCDGRQTLQSEDAPPAYVNVSNNNDQNNTMVSNESKRYQTSSESKSIIYGSNASAKANDPIATVSVQS